MPAGAKAFTMKTLKRGLAQAWRDCSASAIAAGLLAVTISYAGPLLIFLQAGKAAGLSAGEMASWVWAISMGAGVCGIVLSLWCRAPVITAWSAPGTAMLAAMFPATTMSEVVGAYVVAALACLLIGCSGWFDRLMHHVPRGVAAGMMAGILFQFGVRAFKAMEPLPLFGLVMITVYLLARRWRPRVHILVMVAVGVAWAMFGSAMPWAEFQLSTARPVWVSPVFTWHGVLGLALPLVLVSLSGQYLPGMAILNSAGYRVSASRVLVVTSLGSLAVACAGGISIVLAAITAALCTGTAAHERPERRYIAGVANGLFYVLGSCFAGAIVWLFTHLPAAFVAVLAGLALIGAIASSLAQALHAADSVDAAVMTFLMTASGMSWFGLSSPFWGLVIGLASYHLLSRKPFTQAT
jgi:benzoate membrane transport protein